MRLLVEYSHPAQVHKFKHTLRALRAAGHEVLILSRDKDVMLKLLDAEALPHVCISRAAKSLAGMALELLRREALTFWRFIVFKPDLALSAHSVAIAHMGRLFRVPVIVHDDTEHARLQQRLYMPFATHIVTSTAYLKDWGPRQIRINSLEPLAYLHPDHFTPDPSVLDRYGLSPDRPFAVVRLISWQAAHDRGLAQQDGDGGKALLDRLLDCGIDRIVLTTEGSTRLSDPRLVRVHPEDLHHVLAFARICVSEGGSVAIEAAVLGVPTLLVNPLRCGHLQELETYGLLLRADSLSQAGDLAGTLLAAPDTPDRWRTARARLLREKDNMATAFTRLLLQLLAQRTASVKTCNN